MPDLSSFDRLRLNADLMRLVRDRSALRPGPGLALAQARNAAAMVAILQKLGLPAPSVSIYNSGEPSKDAGMTDTPNPLIPRLLPTYAKYGEALAAVRDAEAAGQKPTSAQKSAVTRTLTNLNHELERYNDYGRKPGTAPTVEELAAVYDAQVAALKAEREELAGQPTLTLDELGAKAVAALELVKPREKYGTREAQVSTMLPDGSVVTCTAADDRVRSRYGYNWETKRVLRYTQDGKVISKDSLLRLLGGKARRDINEPLRAAFEAQAPDLEKEYHDYVIRVFEHQKEAQGGSVAAYPEGKDKEETQRLRELTAGTLMPHCDVVREAGKSVLVLNPSKLQKMAKEYGEQMAVQWFYKTNEKLGPLEHAELHSDRGGDVVVTGTRNGHAVRMAQQRVLKATEAGRLYHQFPARLYVDGKFMPEAIYLKLFKD